MNKHKSDFGVTFYREVLPNGLEVIIVPNNKIKNTYASYSTRYGGIHNEFVPNGKKQMISVPKGIAHFLEHKMFEQKNGEDAFTLFSKNGSSANAFTSARKTSYIFSGSTGFYDNLESLLSYVEDPFFTDENVEKEKGIIIEEIHMGDDNPYSRLYKGVLYNTFTNHPMKYPVIGTDDSVRSITKEDLYKCYNTFYHPSNMFVIVTGNVDPDKTIELIRKHEEKRKLKEAAKIKVKEFTEPDEVEKKEEKIKMDITIPKLGMGFKIRIKDLNIPSYRVNTSLINGLALHFDSTSLFYERLQKEDLIHEPVAVNGFECDDHLFILFTVETQKPKEVAKEILANLKDLSITSEELERRKRAGISEVVMSSENVYRMNNILMGQMISLGDVDYNPIETIKSYTLEEYNSIINNINFDNYTIFEIDPLKED